MIFYLKPLPIFILAGFCEIGGGAGNRPGQKRRKSQPERSRCDYRGDDLLKGGGQLAEYRNEGLERNPG